MKHTVCGFQQKRLVELNLDGHDALILRWFIDFKDAGEMQTIQYNDYTWYWISYQYIIDELPIIGITNRESLSRRLMKLVNAGILERYIVKKNGTYTYYRIIPKTYIKLIKHPTQKSGSIKTPDSKVDPNDSTQKSGATRPKSRPKDSSTKNHILSLTVEAEKNMDFIHAFNDFCVEDDEFYRKDKSYWVFNNAIKYQCSLGDVIDALNICCNKGKEGSLSYFTGILREKNKARGKGIKAFGKPVAIQVEEYLSKRLSGHMDLMSGFDVDHKSGTVWYTMRDTRDTEAMQEVLNNIIAMDVKNHTGIGLKFRLR